MLDNLTIYPPEQYNRSLKPQPRDSLKMMTQRKRSVYYDLYMEYLVTLVSKIRQFILKYFFNIYLYWSFEKQKLLIKRVINSNNGSTNKTLNHFLKSNKTTKKTGFVLGAGPTINKIPKYKWKIIRDNFSIGFNLWTLHKFVPNVYAYEIANGTEMSRRHQEILKRRISLDYRNVDIFFKNIWQGRSNRYSDFIDSTLLTEQFFSSDFLLPHYTKQAVEKFMIHYGEYVQRNNTFLYHGYIPQLLSTPFWCTILLSELGFTEIVYCGVDMYSPGYFFDNIEYNMFPELTPRIPKGKKTHKAFSSYDYNFIDVVDILNNYVLKPNNINLFVENRKSLLSQVLPVWDC